MLCEWSTNESESYPHLNIQGDQDNAGEVLLTPVRPGGISHKLVRDGRLRRHRTLSDTGRTIHLHRVDLIDAMEMKPCSLVAQSVCQLDHNGVSLSGLNLGTRPSFII